MRGAAIFLTASAILLLSGCTSLGDVEAAAREAATEFYADLASGDTAAACDLLLPTVRGNVEDESGASCDEALTELDLPSPSTIITTDVYSGAARVVFDQDTVFLTEFGDGWRVHAAGCVPRPEQPYKCEIEAG